MYLHFGIGNRIFLGQVLRDVTFLILMSPVILLYVDLAYYYSKLSFFHYLSVETSSHCVRDRDKQEIRHDYHVVYLPQHAHYDA